jgi:hypothetical protein
MRDVPITNRQVWWLAFEAALAGTGDAKYGEIVIVDQSMRIADEAVRRYRDAEVNK